MLKLNAKNIQYKREDVEQDSRETGEVCHRVVVETELLLIHKVT